MAYRLFSQKKTTGSRKTPVKFIAAWKSPVEVPVPEGGEHGDPLSADLRRVRRPDGMGELRGHRGGDRHQADGAVAPIVRHLPPPRRVRACSRGSGRPARRAGTPASAPPRGPGTPERSSPPRARRVPPRSNTPPGRSTGRRSRSGRNAEGRPPSRRSPAAAPCAGRGTAAPDRAVPDRADGSIVPSGQRTDRISESVMTSPLPHVGGGAGRPDASPLPDHALRAQVGDPLLRVPEP